MSGGLQVTFDILSTTRNESAVPVLLKALDVVDRRIQTAAVKGLVRRRSADGQRELIRRWPRLRRSWKAIIAERPAWISQAIRDAILGDDPELQQYGCEMTLWIRDYDLIPVLIRVAEDQGDSGAALAGETVRDLAEQLSEELASPRDYRRRQDPQTLRRRVLSALEQSVRRFHQHQRTDLLEAFLLLTGRDNSVLKSILQNPRDKVYLNVVHLLTQSERPAIVRLLIRFFEEIQAPATIRHIVARRRDLTFVRYLLQRWHKGAPAGFRANVRRMTSFAWLQDDLSMLGQLTDIQQQTVVGLVTASGMNRLQVFEVIKHVLLHGGVRARRAATEALAAFKGKEANQLVLRSLNDDDAKTQAIAARQLRQRSIPNALQTLIDLLNSPHEVVREAARENLTEFRFRRYLDTFDTLTPDVRRETGQLVKQVDPNAIEELLGELQSNARSRRQRALAMIDAMDVVGDMEEALLQMTRDDDQRIRAEAARLLSHCDTKRTRRALRQLLTDDSTVVKQAVEEALQTLAERDQST